MRLRGTFLLSLAVPIVALVVLAACGGSSSGSSGGGGATASTPPAASAGSAGSGGSSVTIQNFAFTPPTLTVAKGAKVTWTNKDSVPHDVTSTDGPSTSATKTSLFTSGSMGTGQSFSFTFTKPGKYFYECSIHAAEASMHAEVIVK